MKLVLASSNPGKLSELRALLGSSIDLHAQSEFGVGDAVETGLTFVENALIKARHAARATGLPALADDSGLCVDALHGAPGLHSARYAGTHGDDLLHRPDDPMPLIAQGAWEGRILRERRGAGGFGYDPVFFSPAHGCGSAELPPEVKNRDSHRAMALAKLRAGLVPPR